MTTCGNLGFLKGKQVSFNWTEITGGVNLNFKNVHVFRRLPPVMGGGGVGYWLGPESIEWFMEGQTFSASYDLAPRPPPPPSPVSSLPVCRRSNLLTGEES